MMHAEAPLTLAAGHRHAARSLRWDLCWLGATVLLTVALLLTLSPWDLAISLSVADLRGGAFGQFVQDWGRKPASLLIIGAAGVLTAKSFRAAHPLYTRASAALAVQLLLQAALLTNLLKLISGRPRPLHLAPGGEDFVAFSSFAPGLGDFSFPSGHVAVAMILAPCVVLLWREGRRPAAFAVGLLTFGWAGLVAFGRVAHGAHFPTDVAFSIGLGVGLAPLSLRIADDILRRMVMRAGSQP